MRVTTTSRLQELEKRQTGNAVSQPLSPHMLRMVECLRDLSLPWPEREDYPQPPAAAGSAGRAPLGPATQALIHEMRNL